MAGRGAVGKGVKGEGRRREEGKGKGVEGGGEGRWKIVEERGGGRWKREEEMKK